MSEVPETSSGTEPQVPEGNLNSAVPVGTPAAPVDNEAWKPIWDDFDNDPGLKFVADKIKSKLRPHLSKQDLAYQEVTTKYSPYKEFVDAGVKPEDLRTSFNTLRYANDNPKEFYQKFGDYYNLTAAEVKQIVEDAQPDSENQGDEDPRFAALEKTTNELLDIQKENQRQAYVAQIERGIDTDLAKAKKVHEGNATLKGIPFDEPEILEFVKIQMADGKDISVKAAYDRWVQFSTKHRSFPSAGSLAPKVTPAGGSAGGLPRNDNAGKMPPEIARGPIAKRLEWAKANGLIPN